MPFCSFLVCGQRSSVTETQFFQQHVPLSGGSQAIGQQLSSLFVELEVSGNAGSSPVVGEAYRLSFGDLELLRTTIQSACFRVERTARLIAESRFNNFFIGCLLSGDMVLGQHETRSELSASDIAVLDSSAEYTIDAYGDLDALWVRVPRYRLEGRLSAPRAVMAQRISGDNGLGAVTAQLLRSAYDQALSMNDAQALRLSNAILDLLSMCLSVPASEGGARSNTLLRRLQNYIESRLDDPGLSLDQIARANSISVRYLNKLFAREGVSTARWIRMRRLEQCRADLEATNKREQSISEIAYRYGFGDISSFNRAFKRQYGVNPRSLRS